jgi:cytoskeletal protein CcmA (bactofilin family)
MSVTLVNNSPQLTVATAGTRGLTGAHVVNAEFSGSDLIITLSDGTVVNAGGAILSSSGSNNWVGQQAVNGNVIVTGSFIVSGSNTFINIGPTILSGSVNAGTTSITGSLIVSGGTINVIGTNLISASQQVTFLSINGATTYTQSVANLINQSTASLSSSINVLSGSISTKIDSKLDYLNIHAYLSASSFNQYSQSLIGVFDDINNAHAEVSVSLNVDIQNQSGKNAIYDSSLIALNSFTQSNGVRTTALEQSSSTFIISASALDFTSSLQDGKLQDLQIISQSLLLSASSLAVTSSNNTSNVVILFTSSSALNTSASTFSNRLDTIEFYSGSWGASTDVSSLNTYATASAVSFSAFNVSSSVLISNLTSSNVNISSLIVTASSLVQSSSTLDTSITNVEDRIDTLESTDLDLVLSSSNFSSSILNLTTTSNQLTSSVSSINSVTSSLLLKILSIENTTSSINNSITLLETTASILDTIVNNNESEIINLNTYTSSLKNTISVSGSGISSSTTILGNLIVQGTQTTLETANLKISDKLIEIASGAQDSAQANGAGLYISGANASIIWSSAGNRIELNNSVYINGDITLLGTVDGVDISASNAEFNNISQSYSVSASSLYTSASSLYTSASSLTTSASSVQGVIDNFSNFTSSIYTTFSSSVNTRVTDLEDSIGGAGIGSTVSDLILSASASIVTNNNQTTTLQNQGTILFAVSASANNSSGSLVGLTNQINSLNTSASSFNQSIIDLIDSASTSFTNNTNQNSSIQSINQFIDSFVPYSSSVSSSIAELSQSIAGGNVSSSLSYLNNIADRFIAHSSSAGSGSIDYLSGSVLVLSHSFATEIDSLDLDRIGYIEFVSGSTIGDYISFPPFSASIQQRFSSVLTTINEVSNSAWLDSDQANYSSSIATFVSYSNDNVLTLSSSIWDPALGLSSSIATTTSHSLSASNARIDDIIIGTGFVERSVFNTATSSLSASISTLNSFTASVTGSVNNTVLSASALQTTASNLSAYTSSIQNILIPTNSIDVLVKNDLYVSGNIIAKQYIVSSSEIYITTSFSSGSNVFGNDYGDEHFFSGSVKMFGPLVMREGFLGASGNQEAFIDISGSITSSGQLKVNGITSSFISASTFISASNFNGTFDNVSSQVTISSTTGYSTFSSSLSQSISHSIAEISSSLGNYSSSVATTTTQLSSSVSGTIASVSSSLSASINSLSASISGTISSVSSSLSASINSLSASLSQSISHSVANLSASINSLSASTAVLDESNRLSASALQTTSSNLSAYTHSLQQAISVTGSNLRVLGNANIQNDLIVSGNIIAQQYIISSSVSIITTSFSSGSTIFGDTTNDTHRFTGSVYVTNDVTASNIIGTIIANNAVVSSSLQFVQYGALLTSSVSGTQAVSGTLIVSGTTSLTGSTLVNLVGVQSGSFRVQNGTTQIDSVLLVSNNDYVTNGYVGGVVNVGDYIAGGNTAKFDGGVHISGSLRVLGNAQGSGSYFTGSVWITENEAVSGNLQVVGNSSVSGNFIGTTISASSAVTASSLRVEGLTRINGVVDIDTTEITIGAGGNAEVNETRINTTNLRVDSFSKFFGGIEATSSMTELLSLKIKNRNSDGILYMDDLGSGVEVADSANFTYDGVTFKVGNGDFEIDNSTGNIRTSGSLFVSGGTTLNSTLNVSGAVGITGSLIVTGSTIISSSLRVNNTASFAHLNVTGSTILNNRLQVGTSAAISGNLGVSGSVALSSSLFVSGNITASANANISGDVVITGSLSAFGPIIQLGNLPFVDRTIISGALELSGSYHTMTTNLKATGSTSPADAIYRLTEAQAWSASFTTPSTASGAFLRTPDEFLEYFVGQGSNKRRYITPVWLDETLYADDYFDISVLSGADSDYVF